MNREPVVLYIFRFLIGLGLFVFMMMLYWSSELLERDVKYLTAYTEKMKEDLESSRVEMQLLKNEVVKIILDDQKNDQKLLEGIFHNAKNIERLESNPQRVSAYMPQSDNKPSAAPISLTFSDTETKDRPFIDPKLANLLTKDEFKSEILPSLLGQNFKATGVRRGATVGRPPDLHPFRNEATVQNLVDLCQSSLAQMHVGKYETMAPSFAIKIEERENEKTQEKEFWVHLRRGLTWQPLNPKNFPADFYLHPWFLKKHPVTAHDFKFYVDAVQNTAVESAAPYRNYWGDIKEIEVKDKETFVVRWKGEKTQKGGEEKLRVRYLAKSLTGSLKPLPCFVYKYFPDGRKIIEDDAAIDSYQTNSVWGQNFENHWAKGVIVSCGPWVFDSINDERVVFKRNKAFFDPLAVLVDSMEISFKSTPDSIWQDYKLGELDTYSLLPDQLVELEEFEQSSEYLQQKKQGMGIHRLDYLRRAYNYLGWNQATHYFADKKVRLAMTHAIDRKRIIEQNLNGMGMEISGPFFINSPSNDANILPHKFDQEKARALLEEAGWYDQDGDGIRDKMIEGKLVPFSFNLCYYVKNPVTKINCEYVATALKEIGVQCNLNGLDISDLSSKFSEKSFDAIYFGWALGSPPETPRQLWHSKGAKESGSSNAIGFSNQEADEIIDALDFEFDLAKRQELYHRFHQIIHEEAPYTFLYTSKTSFLYRDYLQNVFIPSQRQDLIPGANVAEPQSELFWIKPINPQQADMAYAGIHP